jgi:hypothetical protein
MRRSKMACPCHRLCFLLLQLLQLSLLNSLGSTALWIGPSPHSTLSRRGSWVRSRQRNRHDDHGHFWYRSSYNNALGRCRDACFSSSSSSLSATASDSALSTSRVPLTRIFNGEREYLFTTKRNVRSFEWTISELEDLFESILCIDGQSVELNAITVLPAAKLSDEDQKDIGRASQIYDVS